MMDIKINGNTYNGVERVRVVRADGTGTYSLCEPVLDALLMGETVDVYYNSVLTKITTDHLKSALINKLILPNVTTIKAQGLMGCKCVEARLPSFITSSGSTLISCGKLEKVVFGKKLAALGGQDLRSCPALKTVVLPYEGVVTINSSTFQDSGVAAGTGYAYVPAAQVDAYKADSVWSAYANQIRAIEDYPDEVA